MRLGNVLLMKYHENSGYASYVMEKEINGASSEPGKGPFVAAFASTNLGNLLH